MSEYTIGPGVQAAMQQADPPDEPRSDEIYLILAEGRRISQTYGRDAIYVWYEEDNAVRRTPFLE